MFKLIRNIVIFIMIFAVSYLLSALVTSWIDINFLQNLDCPNSNFCPLSLTAAGLYWNLGILAGLFLIFASILSFLALKYIIKNKK